MPDEVAERVTVAVPPHDVYHAVANVRRLVRWSPECFAYWVRSGRDGEIGQRWVGFNRRGRYVWFTTSEVVVAVPGEDWLDRRSEAVLAVGRRRADPAPCIP